jgi:hypothetical protein
MWLEVFIVAAALGWAAAISLGVVAWRYWRSIGEWRWKSENYRSALRRCDCLLRECLERTVDWEHDPTLPEKLPPRIHYDGES